MQALRRDHESSQGGNHGPRDVMSSPNQGLRERLEPPSVTETCPYFVYGNQEENCNACIGYSESFRLWRGQPPAAAVGHGQLHLAIRRDLETVRTEGRGRTTGSRVATARTAATIVVSCRAAMAIAKTSQL